MIAGRVDAVPLKFPNCSTEDEPGKVCGRDPIGKR